MADHLKAKLESIRKHTDSVKRRASLYSSVGGIGDVGMARSLGAVQRAPAPGKKLQKIGFIIFWIPEPTGITNAIGAPMILAGKFLEKKYNSSTIKDVHSETQSTISSIRNFKDTVF